MDDLGHAGVMIQTQIQSTLATEIGRRTLIAKPHIGGVTITSRDFEHDLGVAGLKSAPRLLFIAGEEAHQAVIICLALGMQIRQVYVIALTEAAPGANMLDAI